ncbi:MAG: hypothetical protein IPP98_09210 [Gemmatimonadetes bacterium]|nr:hypothetical protein [Gemmatimonadota bacterium]
MPITIRSAHGTVATLDDWAAAVPAKLWKQRASSRALAEAWLAPGPRPAEPEEFAALLDSDRLAGLTLGTVQPHAAIAVADTTWHADLAITAHAQEGPVAIVVEAVADERFGDRLGSLLVDVARQIGRDEPSPMVERVQRLAAAMLPPWRTGLPHLDDLRHDLLMGVAATMAFAESIDATRAIYIVHELVHLDRTKESDRRKNREELDLFVRRISNGADERLKRGVLTAPITVPGYPGIALQLGKARRDLDR